MIKNLLVEGCAPPARSDGPTCSTWPVARSLSPAETAARAIVQQIDLLHRQDSERQSRNPAGPTRITFGARRLTAAVSAGLTHIADASS
jgi:hypothetical protein